MYFCKQTKEGSEIYGCKEKGSSTERCTKKNTRHAIAAAKFLVGSTNQPLFLLLFVHTYYCTYSLVVSCVCVLYIFYVLLCVGACNRRERGGLGSIVGRPLLYIPGFCVERMTFILYYRGVQNGVRTIKLPIF